MKINKCKEYQVNSEMIKCLEKDDAIKHSKTCLEEQKLKEKYPSAKEIVWISEKQNWSINFNYLDKSHQTKVKKTQEQQEEVFGELGEDNE